MRTGDLEDAWARFKAAAQRYCAVVESALASPDPQQLHTDLATCLAELYAAALALPRIAPDTDQIDLTNVDPERRADLYRALLEIVDADGPYCLRPLHRLTDAEIDLEIRLMTERAENVEPSMTIDVNDADPTTTWSSSAP